MAQMSSNDTTSDAIPEKDEESTNSSPQCGEYENLPVDRGWAWMIALAVFLLYAVYGGIHVTVSVLLLDLLDQLDMSITTMTLQLALNQVCYGLSSQISANFLSVRFSIRKMATLAAVVNAVATVCLVALPSAHVFILAMCLKTTFHGITLVPAVSLIGFYFEKKRAFAMSFCILGLSFGASTVPLLINFLRLEYGLRGCLLLYGAVELHAIPIAMLLRPLSGYRTSKTGTNRYRHPQGEATPSLSSHYDSHTGESHLPLMESTATSTPTLAAAAAAAAGTTAAAATDKKDEISKSCTRNDLELKGKAKCFNPSLEVSDRSATNANFNVSRVCHGGRDPPSCDHNDTLTPGDIRVQKSGTTKEENLATTSEARTRMITPDPKTTAQLPHGRHNQPASKRNRNLLQTLLTSLVDVELLKKPLAISALLSYNLFNQPIFLNVYLPSFGEEMGATPSQAALLLTVSGMVDVCSKLLIGWLTDRKLMAPYKLIIVGCVSMGVVCQFAPFFHGLGLLLFLASCLGFFGGSGVSLNSVHVIELLGVRALSKMLALCILTFSVTAVVQNMLIGVLIDTTGSFRVPMHYCGINYLLASLVLSLTPLTRKLQTSWERKRLENSH